MEHINHELGLVGFILPDTYSAESVRDVKEHLPHLKKPSKITIKNTMCGVGYPAEVLIMLYGVTVEPETETSYRTYDSTSELLVDKIEEPSRVHPDSVPLEEIRGGRFSEVYLLHQPYGGLTSLYGAMRDTRSEKFHSRHLNINEMSLLTLLPALG